MAHRHLDDIQKLLEIAESEPEKKEKKVVRKKPTDAEKYIKHFGIKAGEEKVPARLVYHHYRKWRKQNFISRRWFLYNFGRVFEKCSFRSATHYYLDPEPFDLSLESRVRANTFLRKERSGKKKKKESQS